MFLQIPIKCIFIKHSIKFGRVVSLKNQLNPKQTLKGIFNYVTKDPSALFPEWFYLNGRVWRTHMDQYNASHITEVFITYNGVLHNKLYKESDFLS